MINEWHIHVWTISDLKAHESSAQFAETPRSGSLDRSSCDSCGENCGAAGFVEALAGCLPTLESLETLALVGCNLSAKELASLAPAVPQGLKSLDLTLNFAYDDAEASPFPGWVWGLAEPGVGSGRLFSTRSRRVAREGLAGGDCRDRCSSSQSFQRRSICSRQDPTMMLWGGIQNLHPPVVIFSFL